jgi:glycosyltransferase involved in cell wall biosynthesis
MTATGYVLISIPVAIAAYAYVVYPAILWLAAQFRKQLPTHASSALLTVSIVVPAYNEEKQIGGAIDALLAQDYPHERTQILILSDASTDRTDEIVRSYATRGVELLRMPERGGKTKAENASCAVLRGSIIVNTDSSIRLHPAAVRELVAHMADPLVGVASGRDISIAAMGQTNNITEAGYVGYEMWIRAMETRTGGIVGASGSCYATRDSLHRIPLRDDLSRDFSAALTAREHGLIAVSVDSAICFVPRTGSLRREYRRKLRTITRGMNTLYARRALLNPARYGSFAWKLVSHKIARWAVPVAVIPGVIGFLLLAPSHTWAAAALILIAMFLVVAFIGVVWPGETPIPSLLSVAAFATAANLAVVHALWRILTGQRDPMWEPTRR